MASDINTPRVRGVRAYYMAYVRDSRSTHEEG